MSRKDFVDKSLFGLKGKLHNYSVKANIEKAAIVSTSNHQTIKYQSDKENEPENAKVQQHKESVLSQSKSEQTVPRSLPSEVQREDTNTVKAEISKARSHTSDEQLNKSFDHISPKTETVILDKEYSKALVERRKEFIHKRSDILKRIKLNLEKLPHDIEKYEKLLSESRNVKGKLIFLVESINTTKEKEWDKKDFSIDLANAMKKIENARLELFTLQQKTDCLLKDDIPGLEKNRNSFVPELTSLSAGQIFKLGMSFFFPLVIGLLLTGILISIAIFIAMGVI
jgi:hypothetical protein